MKAKDIFFISLSIAVVLAGLVAGYYFVFYIPKKEKETKEELRVRQQIEAQIKSQRELQLNSCILQAETKHKERWNRHCKELGKKEECLLPMLIVNSYTADLEAEKDLCFRKFK